MLGCLAPWIWIAAWPVPNYVTSGKLLNSSEPQCSRLENYAEDMQRFNEVILLKAWAQGLQHDNSSMGQMLLLFKCVFPEIPIDKSEFWLRIVGLVWHRAFAKVLKNKPQTTEGKVLNLQGSIQHSATKKSIEKKKVPVLSDLTTYGRNE